jgi:hypothetical protein
MKIRNIVASLAAALALCAAPAFADTGISSGVFLPGDGSTALGLVGSYNLLGIPGTPIKVQLTGGLPFGPGGRFAAVVEGEYESGRFFGGGGAGGGKMRVNGAPDAMYDFFAGVRVVPLISLQARYFGSGSAKSGSAMYLGASFGLK